MAVNNRFSCIAEHSHSRKAVRTGDVNPTGVPLRYSISFCLGKRIPAAANSSRVDQLFVRASGVTPGTLEIPSRYRRSKRRGNRFRRYWTALLNAFDTGSRCSKRSAEVPGKYPRQMGGNSKGAA